MTIRRRVILLSTAGAAVMVAALGQFYRLSLANAELAAEETAISTAHGAIQRIDLLACDYMLYGEPRARVQLGLLCAQLRRDAPGMHALAPTHRQAIAEGLERAESLIAGLDQEPQAPGNPAQIGSPRTRYLAEQLIIASHEMLDQAGRWQARMAAARVDLLREASISAIAASGVQLLLLAAGALLLVRTIVLPVERLKRGVAAVAAGDLTTRVPVGRRDELGVLGEAFNGMAESLALAERARERAAEIEARSAGLERINRDLEHFAALASHELQAPLRTAGNFIEVIQRRIGPQLDDATRGYLQRVVEATVRMRSLIESLLRFSRAGSVEAAQDADIASRAAVEQALETLSGPIAEAKAVITVGDLPLVRIDGIQLIQVFLNLIVNAIHYRDRGRTLHIAIRALAGPDGYHTLVVEDDGPGIDPRWHERIFDMFQRADRQDAGGTGIGLALCRKIVRIRGGEITVRSESGRGATFLFTVPAATGVPGPQRSSRRLDIPR